MLEMCWASAKVGGFVREKLPLRPDLNEQPPIDMTFLLELIKITVPSLIVFLTVWFLMREYFQREYRLRLMDVQRKAGETTLPLRLQAYERMSIFTERISLPKLILRIRTEGMTAQDLQAALMITVEQEFDHNVSQQIYMSGELWLLLEMTKNEAIGLLAQAGKDLPDNATGQDFSNAVFRQLDEQGQVALRQCQIGLRKEVHLLL